MRSRAKEICVDTQISSRKLLKDEDVYLVSKRPVVVNQTVIDNNSVLHTNNYNVYYYKNTLHVSTLKGSSSGAKSNKLTTHIQRYTSSQTSDNSDAII
jgi:hypothetical protein